MPAPLPPLRAPTTPADWATTDRLHPLLAAESGWAVPIAEAVPSVPKAHAQVAHARAAARLVPPLWQEPAFVDQATRSCARLGVQPEDPVMFWSAILRNLTWGAPEVNLAPTALLYACIEDAWGLPPGAPLGPGRPEDAAVVCRRVGGPVLGPRLDALRDPAWWQGETAGLRAYVRVQYRVTQAWLAAHGITEAVVYRGLVAPGPGPGFHGHAPVLRTVSWWSTSWAHARSYVVTAPGLLLAAVVPAARILACLPTGSAGWGTSEVLVLGGGPADRAWALAWAQPEAAAAYWTAVDYQAAAAAQTAGRWRPLGPTAPPDPWRRFAPHGDWFTVPPNGPHGVGHAARVLVWANRVARQLAAAGTAIDLEVVRWAAVAHDCRRAHDDDDPGHGARAAAWFGAHAAEIAPALTPAQVAAVQYCIRWHDSPDTACPQMTPELVALKDGDGVDRVRFGPGGCDVRQLRTPYLRGVPAWALFLVSHHAAHPWAAIRAQAQAWGCWGEERAPAPRPAAVGFRPATRARLRAQSPTLAVLLADA